MPRLFTTGSSVTEAVGTAEAVERRAATGKRFYTSRMKLLKSYRGTENQARAEFALFQLSAAKKSWCEGWTWNGPPLRTLEHRSDNISADYDGPLVRDLQPWHDNATVSASTAALSINLTELCPVHTLPINVFNFEGGAAYQIDAKITPPPWGYPESQYLPWCMYLLSEQALDDVVRTGDVIFILDTAESTLLFPILRPSADTVGSFRLVACAYDAFFEFPRTSVPPAAMPGRADQQFLYLVDLQRSLNSIWEGVLDDLTGLFPSGSELAEATGQTITALLLGVEDADGILAVMQAHLDDDRRSGIDPLQIYFGYIHPRFRPLLIRAGNCDDEVDKLELRVSPNDRETLKTGRAQTSRPLGIPWTWRYASDPEGRWRNDDFLRSEDIILSTDRRRLRFYLSMLPQFRALKKISLSFYASGKRKETEILALIRNQDCRFTA